MTSSISSSQGQPEVWDNETLICSFIRTCITLAKCCEYTYEQLLMEVSGTTEFPSIARLHNDDLIPEWTWATEIAQRLLEDSEQVAVKLFDISTVENEKGFIIEVKSDSNTIYAEYAVPEIHLATAQKIEEIVAICLEHHGVMVGEEIECETCENVWIGDSLNLQVCPECYHSEQL
jgi:hypothetical protein